MTTLAQTARKAHACAACDWRTNPDTPPSIAPGHRYLIHVSFPGDDGHPYGLPPSRDRVCVACAEEADYAAATLVAGACGSFCCGTTPCALPFERGAPGHRHSCREDARARARVTA